MRSFFKIIIIGGGASGLFAATMLADKLNGKDIAVLEKNDRVGKKLSQTGNGQGNLTNSDMSLKYFHGSDKNFPKYALEKYGFAQIEDFYKKIGIFLCGEGKRYPVSKQASAVTDALRLNLEKKGVTVLTDAEVKQIEKEKNIFVIDTEENTFKSEIVLFAFGGKAGKPYGTDGSAYFLAQNFGHTLTALYPSLVQLKTQTFKGLKGIKTEVVLTAIGEEKTYACGDLLFTEYGVSGNAVFAVSGTVAKGGRLEVEFLPDYSLDEVKTMLKVRKFLGYDGIELTSGLLHKMLGKVIYESSDGSVDGYAEKIKKFPITVTGTLDFNFAQVTKGGINTDEVDPKTMQSKLTSGAYIVGEALDVDGDCGGYNLHWAYASAAVACEDICKRLSGGDI